MTHFDTLTDDVFYLVVAFIPCRERLVHVTPVARAFAALLHGPRHARHAYLAVTPADLAFAPCRALVLYVAHLSLRPLPLALLTQSPSQALEQSLVDIISNNLSLKSLVVDDGDSENFVPMVLDSLLMPQHRHKDRPSSLQSLSLRPSRSSDNMLVESNRFMSVEPLMSVTRLTLTLPTTWLKPHWRDFLTLFPSLTALTVRVRHAGTVGGKGDDEAALWQALFYDAQTLPALRSLRIDELGGVVALPSLVPTGRPIQQLQCSIRDTRDLHCLSALTQLQQLHLTPATFQQLEGFRSLDTASLQQLTAIKVWCHERTVPPSSEWIVTGLTTFLAHCPRLRVIDLELPSHRVRPSPDESATVSCLMHSLSWQSLFAITDLRVLRVRCALGVGLQPVVLGAARPPRSWPLHSLCLSGFLLAPEQLRCLLQSAGATLVDLQLIENGPTVDVTAMPMIASHCHQLRHLVLTSSATQHTDSAGLNAFERMVQCFRQFPSSSGFLSSLVAMEINDIGDRLLHYLLSKFPRDASLRYLELAAERCRASALTAAIQRSLPSLRCIIFGAEYTHKQRMTHELYDDGLFTDSDSEYDTRYQLEQSCANEFGFQLVHRLYPDFLCHRWTPLSDEPVDVIDLACLFPVSEMFQCSVERCTDGRRVFNPVPDSRRPGVSGKDAFFAALYATLDYEDRLQLARWDAGNYEEQDEVAKSETDC